MYSDQIPKTGVLFIDESVSLIDDCVDNICELLLSQDTLDEILKRLDDLMDKTENHLNQKIECQDLNDCVVESYAHEVIEKLIDLKNILQHFGPTMKPKVAEMEVRLWAKNNIHRNNKKCVGCKKRALPNETEEQTTLKPTFRYA